MRLDETALFEVAHLHCVLRLARGTVHALNNALTAVAGLVDAGGEGAALERELDRCTRLVRGLSGACALRFGRGDEAELGAAVRRMGATLCDTLGRRFEVALDTPAELLHVEIDPARVELLLLVLVCRVTDLSQAGGRLLLSAAPGEKPDTACLQVELRAPGLAADAAERLLDPQEGADTGLTAALRAAALVAAEALGSLATCATPGGLRVRATFPSAA